MGSPGRVDDAHKVSLDCLVFAARIRERDKHGRATERAAPGFPFIDHDGHTARYN